MMPMKMLIDPLCYQFITAFDRSNTEFEIEFLSIPLFASKELAIGFISGYGFRYKILGSCHWSGLLAIKRLESGQRPELSLTSLL